VEQEQLAAFDGAYEKLKKNLRGKRFFERSFSEISASVRGFGLVRPESRKYQEPGEICFVYRPPQKYIDAGNDYRAIVWSTKRRIGWVGIDSGWVIIVNRFDKRVYSVGPFIRRSEAFFEDLFEEARFARWRVFQRPKKCPKGCNAYMLLVHRHGRLKSCYWQCAIHPEGRSHDRRFDDLEEPPPPEKMEQRSIKRKERKKKRRKISEDGGDPFAAFKKRMQHSWVKEETQMEFQF